MHQPFNDKLGALLASRRPFAIATVVRVRGSASARPGSKALVDEHGRNVFGWVGGGCAESLVREEALAALEERRTRIVTADLDDEVLGVGMPCGGVMDVFIEPVYPRPVLLVAGQNQLARALTALAANLGFAVTVHGPEAEPQAYAGAERVVTAPYEALAPPPEAAMVVCTQHRGDVPALRAGLRAGVDHLALVANRANGERALERLRAEGFGEETLAQVRTPAGLDLGGRTPETIALSLAAELLARRGGSCLPLREVKGTLADFGGAAAERPPTTDPADGAGPELLVMGHGRIAEELARLGALLGWAVTVNSPGAAPEDYPAPTRIVADDLDFSAMRVGAGTFVVIATQHKGDHLSMRRALQGDAPYIGLIASAKRARLVLDFLCEQEGTPPQALQRIHAPAGLELAAATPAEIALSVMSEALMRHHGATGRPMNELERPAGTRGASSAEGCKGLLD